MPSIVWVTRSMSAPLPTQQRRCALVHYDGMRVAIRRLRWCAFAIGLPRDQVAEPVALIPVSVAAHLPLPVPVVWAWEEL